MADLAIQGGLIFCKGGPGHMPVSATSISNKAELLAVFFAMSGVKKARRMFYNFVAIFYSAITYLR